MLGMNKGMGPHVDGERKYELHGQVNYVKDSLDR